MESPVERVEPSLPPGRCPRPIVSAPGKRATLTAAYPPAPTIASGPNPGQHDGEEEGAGRDQPQTARTLGRPRRDRTLDRKRDAGPATHPVAPRRADPRDPARPAVRAEMEEGLLRPAGSRLDHRAGRLRRLGEHRVLRRRQVRPAAAAGGRLALRQAEDAGGSPRAGNPRVDRTGGEDRGLEVSGTGSVARLQCGARPGSATGYPAPRKRSTIPGSI